MMGRMPKNNTTSPTPANAAWRQQQQQQPEGYQYQPATNQLSPSRSPSGPTYTQLGGAGGPRNPSAYHAPGPQQGKLSSWKTTKGIILTPCFSSGVWGWPQQQGDGGPNGPQATSGAVPVVPGPPPPPGAQQGPHGQELSDMLQMLDQTGTNSFEDLNIHMFSTPFE